MKKIIKKGDIIVVISIFLIAIILFFAIQKTNLNNENIYLSIQVDKEEVNKILIDSNTNETYPVKSEYGTNLVEIKEGKVRVIEASCPDKIDEKQGYIENVGEIIVCIPNRLILELKNNTENTELDAVNY